MVVAADGQTYDATCSGSAALAHRRGLDRIGTVPTETCAVVRVCSGPRQGVPRRVASLNSQVDAFVNEQGGDRPIHRCVGVAVKPPGGSIGICTWICCWGYHRGVGEEVLMDRK